VNVNEFLNQWEGYRTGIKNINKCNIWYMYMRIEENGNVYPCNNTDDEYNMWNINDSKIQDIWNNFNYKQFREKIYQWNLLNGCCHKDEGANGSNYKIRRLIDEKESNDIPTQEQELYI